MFVAILRHDVTPLDELVQANALWVKCPKHKPIAALQKAYSKQPGCEVDVCLRHDFKVIDNRIQLNDLCTPGQEVLALEAVRISDLHHRNALSASQRKPLQDVTNQARQTPVLDTKEVQSKNRFPELPSNRQSMIRASPASTHTPQHQTHSITPSPANATKTAWPSVVPHYELSMMAPGESMAWADFAYEHREYNERMCRRAQQAVHPAFMTEGDKNMERNWHALDAGQKSYYVKRVRKLVPTLATKHYHRGFWCFYYDMYYATTQSLAFDPHANIESTEAFTDETIAPCAPCASTIEKTASKRCICSSFQGRGE